MAAHFRSSKSKVQVHARPNKVCWGEGVTQLLYPQYKYDTEMASRSLVLESLSIWDPFELPHLFLTHRQGGADLKMTGVTLGVWGLGTSQNSTSEVVSDERYFLTTPAAALMMLWESELPFLLSLVYPRSYSLGRGLYARL